MQGGQLADAFPDGVVLLDWGPSLDGDANAHADETTQAQLWLGKLQQKGLCMQLKLRPSTDTDEVRAFLLLNFCFHSNSFENVMQRNELWLHVAENFVTSPDPYKLVFGCHMHNYVTRLIPVLADTTREAASLVHRSVAAAEHWQVPHHC